METHLRNRAYTSRQATEVMVCIAGGQHGLITGRQALRAGLTSGLIAGRVESGWLVPVFNGVYSLGIGVTEHSARLMAATLAGGSSAVLSHYSAAALHGFRDHGSKRAFRTDRNRDVDLMLGGYKVARFSWEAVAFEGFETAAKIKRLIGL